MVHLVRCALQNEQPTEPPQGLSFEICLDCAIKHEIANIAYYSIERLNTKPSQETLTQWGLYRDFAIERDFNQWFARDEIANEFKKMGIRFLEVQGTKIKELYPAPELRTMSDIDFIIDIGNLERAGEILQELGYDCKWLDSVEIDGVRAPNIHVELHTEYFPVYSEYHECMRSPFSSIEENGQYDDNEFYIYNMLHIAKHYFCRGCGIRRVLDVYYLNHHFSNIIDRKYVHGVFQKAGVVDFVENISMLAGYWFGNSKYSESFKDMIPFITGNPLHGTEENQMGYFLQKEFGNDAKFIKIRHVTKKVFAGDDIMLKHYPFLKKWRILYPACWIHRVIRALVHGKKIGIYDEMKLIMKANLHKK